jgi:hypothetical protein
VARHPPSDGQVSLAGTRLRVAVALHGAVARDHLSGASDEFSLAVRSAPWSCALRRKAGSLNRCSLSPLPFFRSKLSYT